MSQSLTDRVKKASKIKMPLFEQERHIVLETMMENRSQAISSLPKPGQRKEMGIITLNMKSPHFCV